MSFFAFGAPNSYLQRFDTLSEHQGGKTRFVSNKGADQSGHVDTENVDGTGHWEIFCYCPTAIAAYTPVHLTWDGDEETNPTVIAFTNAGNDNYRHLVVPQEAIAATSWGWCAFAGVCLCFVDGTTNVAKDDYLFLDTDGNGGLTALMTSGGAVETNSTVAIATVAQEDAADTAIRVILLGLPKICDTQ